MPSRRLLLFVTVFSASLAACSKDDEKRFEVRYRSSPPRSSSGGASTGGQGGFDASTPPDGRAEGGSAGTGGTPATGGTGGTGGMGTGGRNGAGGVGPCGCGNISPLVPCCTTIGTCGFVVGAVCLPFYADGGSGGATGTGGAADAGPDQEAGPRDSSSDGKAADSSGD